MESIARALPCHFVLWNQSYNGSVIQITRDIASLGIFQFLWVWNDFLIAKVFLINRPVLTVQITNLIDPLGGNWHILTGAAFLSFFIPMVVFFSFQRYFIRGLVAGSVKG